MKSDIEAFYNENRQLLVKRFSFRVGGIPNAEDVVQEAFARALQYQNSFNEQIQELGAWFNTILNNAARDFKRQEKMEGMTTEDELTPTLEQVVFHQDMVDTVFEEIGTWNLHQREALRLYFLLEYTMKEISEVMDYRIGMIKFIIHDFRRHMKDKYGEDMCS